jgi:hypothetical protein
MLMMKLWGYSEEEIRKKKSVALHRSLVVHCPLSPFFPLGKYKREGQTLVVNIKLE